MKAFLEHIGTLRVGGVDARFSVGAPIDEQVREAIRALPARVWSGAIDAGADLSGLLPGAGFLEGTRFLVRRERPRPGAQLDLFDTIEGYRRQLIATDTPAGGAPLAWRDARHRTHTVQPGNCWPAIREPAPGGPAQRVAVDTGQQSADCRLGGRQPPGHERIGADP
jgi:hypothetical protein